MEMPICSGARRVERNASRPIYRPIGALSVGRQIVVCTMYTFNGNQWAVLWNCLSIRPLFNLLACRQALVRTNANDSPPDRMVSCMCVQIARLQCVCVCLCTFRSLAQLMSNWIILPFRVFLDIALCVFLRGGEQRQPGIGHLLAGYIRFQFVRISIRSMVWAGSRVRYRFNKSLRRKFIESI